MSRTCHGLSRAPINLFSIFHPRPFSVRLNLSPLGLNIKPESHSNRSGHGIYIGAAFN